MAGILSGLWKGLFGSRQDELNEKATEESIFQMQHPFARTMEDAQNYGINPITALGATPSASTYSGSSASSSPADALGLLAPIMQSVVSRQNNADALESQERIADKNNKTAKEIQDSINDSNKQHWTLEQDIAMLRYKLDKAYQEHKITQEQKDMINKTSLTMAQVDSINAEVHRREEELANQKIQVDETKRHNIVMEILQGLGIVGNTASAIAKFLGF